MEDTRRFLRWAIDTQGVRLNGIEPRRLPDRGIGLVANRKIKVLPPPLSISAAMNDPRRSALSLELSSSYQSFSYFFFYLCFSYSPAMSS